MAKVEVKGKNKEKEREKEEEEMLLRDWTIGRSPRPGGRECVGWQERSCHHSPGECK